MRYTVSVPIGRSGNFAVEHFYVASEHPENIRLLLHGRSPIEPGLYTKLTENGAVWMSDVGEEIEEHLPIFRRFALLPRASSVLIHGLGLGMVVQEAIRAPNIRDIFVVEINRDVIDLVGPHYMRMADRFDKNIDIIEGDAFTYKWPVRSYWEAVWHDIWQGYSEDNLAQMETLHRKFGHRCGWQGSWGKRRCQEIRDGRYYRKHQRIVDRFHKSLGLPTDAEIRAQLGQMELTEILGSDRSTGA